MALLSEVVKDWNEQKRKDRLVRQINTLIELFAWKDSTAKLDLIAQKILRKHVGSQTGDVALHNADVNKLLAIIKDLKQEIAKHHT